MGRMLDALRRDHDAPNHRAPVAAPSSSVAALASDEPMLVDADEIPFIEVGPHKSMEASPSVLACAPASKSPLAEVSIPRNEAPPSLAALRNVQFRPLTSRAASRSSFAAELIAHHAPDQPAARQYREIFDAVCQAATASGRSSALLFTAALPHSGATTTLLNLALTAAQRPQCLIVVDANFRRPAVAERLGLAAAPGLREAMTGAVALDEAIRPTEHPNLMALTVGAPVPHAGSGVRFVAETLSSLLRQLRQRFPLVFVDGPRWDGKPDVVALAAACDAVFLVAPESEADTPQTETLLRLIPQQGARLAGCILVADAPYSP